jgi:hypothetical protein
MLALLEYLDNLFHGWPVAGIRVQALVCHGEDEPDLVGGEARQSLVDGVLLPLLFHGLLGPGDEPGAVLKEGLVGGPLAGEELEQDDAVAVDVALGGGPPGVEVLWSEVAEGAGNDGGDVAVAGLDERGEAKVAEPGLHVVVEEDVAGLDVAVDDVRDAVVVEVGQASGHAQRDLVPRRPVHHRASACRLCGGGGRRRGSRWA